MSPTPSGPLPPASAEYETAMHASPGKPPQVQPWKMFRSSQGETHLDFGKTGVISKPGANQAILLDHVKREARIVPLPAGPPAAPPSPAGKPGVVPHLPVPPSSSLLHVKDLGKQMIGGHDAEGKMYTFQPPQPPHALAAPGAKGLPAFEAPKPGAPPQGPGPAPKAGLTQPGAAMPGPAAQAPPAAAPHGQLQTLEVWTHTGLKVPVLTKANGIPGLHSSVCKNARGGEPPASLFQIPQGYKVVEPKPPAPSRGMQLPAAAEGPPK